MEVCEPQLKKAKVSFQEPLPQETTPPSSSLHHQLEEGMQSPSNTSLFFRIVSSRNDLSSSAAWFHPTFTYPVYGTEEIIMGYENLNIRITLHATTLFAHVTMTHDAKEGDAVDPLVALYPHLPNGYTLDENRFYATFDFQAPSILPGNLYFSFENENKLKKKNGHFELYSCSLENKEMQLWHNRMEALAPFFIEGADAITVDQESSGKWTVYHLWEMSEGAEGKNRAATRFAGYTTKYSFCNPVCAGSTADQDTIERICQVLLLPPFQRQGHAKCMVTTIMKDALSNKRVFMMTVEDPVPAFSAVRDVVDVSHCGLYNGWDALVDRTPMTPLSKKEKETISRKMKITTAQIEKCFEMLMYREVTKRGNEERERQFRLMMKRKLYAEMEEIPHADRRKAILQAAYAEKMKYYQTILKKSSTPKQYP